MRIGIIKEGKVPIDKRVPLTPENAVELQEKYPRHQVICQSSDHRCFNDHEYRDAGIEVRQDLSDCDIMLGVKEVPIEDLIPEKTYLFFSHTIKKQSYNRELLREILRKRIRLIDYEKLYDAHGNRVVAFGRYAGIVGAYNALWTYGERYGNYQLRRAHECHDLEDIHSEYGKIVLPPVKIVLTGGGRVARGAMEVLDASGIRRVNPERFLAEEFEEPVYAQLDDGDYNIHRQGKPFSKSEFFSQPDNFRGDFLKYAHTADILIAGAYWDPSAPPLFEIEDMRKPEFNLRIIADITCDIRGSIPSTIRSSTLKDPVYDFDPSEEKEAPPFSNEEHVTVMAIDNLPSELPRDASISFSADLMQAALPRLLGEEADPDKMIAKATITEDGRLTDEFSYLQNYADGKE